MNNKLNNGFSLRKLLLTALVAGPLATLPAPLWALPNITSANLTVSSPSTITVTAPSTTNIQVNATTDKGVLTWIDFGSSTISASSAALTASPILAGDTIQYFLPSASSSILNTVSGTNPTVINGAISSNGNVYVLNPNGIVIGSSATINTGGFYASTVNEPLAAAGFALNGTLSFVGTSTAGVTVNGASFQSVGTGNNIALYGRNVDVNSATGFGNLSLNGVGGAGYGNGLLPTVVMGGAGTTGPAGALITNGGNAVTAVPGAVSINKVAGVGGNLTINSSGGNVLLSGYGVPATGNSDAALTTGVLTGNPTVNAVGSGYPALATIPVIFANPTSSGRAATGYATTDVNGQLNGITVVTGGYGYTAAPTVTIPAPGAGFLAVNTAPVQPLQGITSNIAAGTTIAAASGLALNANGVAATGYAGLPGAYAASSTVNATVVGAPAGGVTGAATMATSATGQLTGTVNVTNVGSAYTVAPAIAFANPSFPVTVPGNLTINTANNTANTAGNVSQQNSLSTVTVSGNTTITAATTTASPVYGTITTSASDFATLAVPAAGKTSIADTGGITLGNINITATTTGDNLVINAGATNSGAALAMSTGAKAQVLATTASGTTAPTISLTGASVTFTGTGALTFSGISTSTSSGGATITGDNNIFFGGGATPGTGSNGNKSLTVTTTGGTISMGALTTTSATVSLTATSDITFNANPTGTGAGPLTLTSGSVTLKSSAGKVYVQGDINAGGGVTITSAGDVNVTSGPAQTSGTAPSIGTTGALAITSSAGSVTVGGQVSAGSGSITAANNISLMSAGTFAVNAASDRGTINFPTSNNAAFSGANGPTSGSLVSINTSNSMPTGMGYAPNATIAVTTAEGSTTAATSLAAGQVYVINSTGSASTDFTLIGAANNNVGTVFTATGAGTGTGAAANLRATSAVATTNSVGQITGITVVNPGTGVTTNPTTYFPAPTNALVTGGAFSLTATSGTVTIPQPVVSTSSSALSITSAQGVVLPAVTAPALSVKSTAGNITQAVGTAIAASGTTTLDAATDVTLSNANNFGTVVLVNGGGGSSGFTLSDINDITVGSGTNAKGNVSITSGVGVTTLAASLVSTFAGSGLTNASLVGTVSGTALGTTSNSLGGLVGPNSQPVLKPATTSTSGIVSGVTVVSGAAGSGYASSTVSGTFALSAAPSPTTTASQVKVSTSASASTSAAGIMFSPAVSGVSSVLGVIIPNDRAGNKVLGVGYTPGQVVAATIADTGLTAGSFVTGVTYQIKTIGTTDYTLIGAASNTVGLTFTATGVGAGTGTAGGFGAAGYAVANANGQVAQVTMTNIGSSYNPATTSVQLALPSNAASVAELAYINTSATGTVSSVGVTGVGTNYFGAYVPVVPVANIPATSGSNATITGITTNAAGALTGITIAGGTQYASAPVLTFGAAGSSAGLAGTVASTTLIAGVPQSIGGLTNATVPLYSGGVNLGVAATDSLTFAGNLTLTTASPAGTVGAFSQNWSQFNTVANTVFVGGNVTLNTNGTNANLGLNPIGGTGKYSFGAINATMGAGTLSVIENTTLNLGAITAANVNATSVGGDIVNSGTITSTGTVTVAANSVFSPGNVTLNNANNVIANVAIQNANNFTLVDSPTATVTVTAGTATPGKALAGSANISIPNGKNAILTTAGGGSYSTVGFNMQGGTIMVNNPASVTIANASNTGTAAAPLAATALVANQSYTISTAGTTDYTLVGAPNNLVGTTFRATGVGTGTGTATPASVTVDAAGAINLGSGIALNSTGLAAFNSTGTSANITDANPNISIFGPVSFVSDLGISITKSGHSLGPVSLISGATGGAAVNGSNVDITYTEAGTANLNVVRVNQKGIVDVTGGTTVSGNLTVVSTAGGIIQTPITTLATAFISVPGGSTKSASFTAASGSGVNLTNPVFSSYLTTAAIPASPVNNAIVAPISIRGTTDSSVAQIGNITLGNVAVTSGAFTADASSGLLGATGYGISQATGTTIFAYGNSTFKTNGGAITLTNAGNNFGGLTLSSNNGIASAAATVPSTAAAVAATTATTASVLANVAGAIPVGTVPGVVFTAAGAGYPVSVTNVPVTVTDSLGTGAGATASATTDATGKIVSIQVLAGGAGYTGNATFAIAAPRSQVAGVLPVGTYTVTGGGSGFAVSATNLPVTVTGAGGTGAIATATTNSSGAVTSVQIINGGSGYTGALSAALTVAPLIPSAVGGTLPTGTYPVTSGGIGYPVSSTSVPATITAAGGTLAAATATTDAYGRVTGIQLTNGGTGYTGAGTLAAPANAVLASQGASIAVTEAGTLNVASASTGTGTVAAPVSLSLTSSGGGLIQSGTGVITAGTALGSTVSLNAAAAGITLNSSNNFGGAPISLVTTGNVTLTDSNATNTILASGTNIGGTATVRNNANGALKDNGGGLTIAGNVLFDVGNGAIAIVGSGNSFGAVQFRGGSAVNSIIIAENTTLNLAAGSVASGQVTLSSLGNIITSGLGTSTFAGAATSLTLSAGGTITVSNPIFVANGLTFRALGAVDLSSLSLIGNLNGVTPTNLGASSYKIPGP